MKIGIAYFIFLSMLPLGIAEEAQRPGWWSGYGTLSLETNTENLSLLSPRAIVGHPVLQDLGQGTLVRQAARWLYPKTFSTMMRSRSIPIAYMDAFGSAPEVMTWIEETGDRKIERFSRNGPGKTLASAWTFADRLSELTDTKAQIQWLGLSHFLNNPSQWLGKFDLNGAKLPPPEGPGGEGVLGFSPSTSNHPLHSNFHSKLSGKSVFGQVWFKPLWQDEAIEKWNKGAPQTTVGAFEFSRDVSAPWWNIYNIHTAKELLKSGARGIWMDYYSGQNFLGERPIESAFGDWSVAEFQRRVLSRRDGGLNLAAASSGLRTYLLEKAKRLDPKFDPKDPKAADHSVWSNLAWADDNSWLAFVAFKTQMLRLRSQELYDAIKAYVKSLGIDPSQIPVILGDVAKTSYPTLTGKDGDLVATEVGPNVGDDFQPLGLGLPDETSYGPIYSLLSALTDNPITHVWFRFSELKNAPSETVDRLNRLALSEALAHNAIGMIPPTENQDGTPIQVWGEFKKLLDAVAPAFAGRDRLAKVGIIYSPSTTLSVLLPGGVPRKADRVTDLVSPAYHRMALQGWALAMEAAQYPYRIIPEFRISKALLSGLWVLVFPQVTALEPSAIPLLTPFLEKGGLIVVNGAGLGRTRTAEGYLQTQPSPFSRWYKELPQNLQNNVVSIRDGVGQEFFFYQRRRVAEGMEIALKTMTEPINKMVATGAPIKDLEAPAAFKNIQIVQHIKHLGKGTTYLDLVNKDFSRESGNIRAFQGGTLTIRNKSLLDSYSVKWAEWESPKWTSLSVKKLDDFTISVQIPRFRYYGSLVLEGIK